MKRIVVCMDGTWQSLSQDELTNIGILARSVAHKETRPDGSFIYQNVIYTQGVGTTAGAMTTRSLMGAASARLNRLAGGAFGEGLEDAVLETYLRLAFDYEADDEIYIFGFSRGAFAARRLAGLINTSGIVSRRHTEKAREAFQLYYQKPRDDASDEAKREHEEAAAQFRRLYGKGRRNPDGTRLQSDEVPQIKYLGVFDTVVQRGAGDVMLGFTPFANKRKHSFANLRVCPNVRAARHAVALDEARIGFPPMLWVGLDQSNQHAGRQAYFQRWFVGTHGDVGGGVGSKLAAKALKWVAEGAAAEGLRFYGTYGDDISPLDEALRDAGEYWDRPITRPRFWKSLQPVHYAWRPRRVWANKERPTMQDIGSYLDDSVLQRASSDHVRPRYMPGPLRPFRRALKDWVKDAAERARQALPGA